MYPPAPAICDPENRRPKALRRKVRLELKFTHYVFTHKKEAFHTTIFKEPL